MAQAFFGISSQASRLGSVRLRSLHSGPHFNLLRDAVRDRVKDLTDPKGDHVRRLTRLGVDHCVLFLNGIWQGGGACVPTCIALAASLDSQYEGVQMGFSSHFTSYAGHCFLRVKDVVIDATFLQFVPSGVHIPQDINPLVFHNNQLKTYPNLMLRNLMKGYFSAQLFPAKFALQGDTRRVVDASFPHHCVDAWLEG
jgi:hypothetical protein